jgi:peptidoglycan/xylan/chitin deacetylase (PgdA/CDA1 family)
MMLRSVVSGRSRSQSSGAAAGVRHVARRLRRTLERARVRCSRAGAGIVLVYHRLDEPGGDPSRELVPALATSLFEAQLERLRSKYRIVPPSALHEEVRRRRFGGRIPLAVTFDDDLASHVEVALPVLRRLGIPAGFFLCGASLERPYSFWWDDLQRAVDGRAEALGDIAVPGVTSLEDALARKPGSLRAAARAIEQAPPNERARIAAELRKITEAEEAGTPLDASGARALAEAGFEIGFHTLRHEPLPTVDDAELARALGDGRAQLEQVVGHPLKMLAYPHGRADTREARAVRAAGYACAFTGRPEAVRADDDPFLLGRIEPSFESVEVLEAQLGRALRATRR